jgi:hypothetical protein
MKNVLIDEELLEICECCGNLKVECEEDETYLY